MTDPLVTALILAVGLILLGGFTLYRQRCGLRLLTARKHVPSDEASYLRNRYRRRMFTGGLFIVIGLLIGGAYLSGMEQQADELQAEKQPVAEKEPKPVNAEGPKMTPEQKRFVRIWGLYWIVILLLVFALFLLAIRDAWASRRYWNAQLRQLREDHQTKLRRDLAVHRKHREQARSGRLGNRNGGDTAE